MNTKTIFINKQKVFDNDTEMFYDVPECKLELMHSLISVSKWESRWHKSFLNTEDKTGEMMLDYIRCMTISKNVDPIVYYAITPKEINEINKYMEDPMTATTFREPKRGPSRHIITNEEIYYLMIYYGIPKECEKWHLNRLLTLIHICELKNAPKKKMSPQEILMQDSQLNKARIARMKNKAHMR